MAWCHVCYYRWTIDLNIGMIFFLIIMDSSLKI